jgi:pimeloyl-ACP methyl ester carboxylesterase
MVRVAAPALRAMRELNKVRKIGREDTMPRMDVNGIGIAYEIVGDGKRPAIITPGGRFSKQTPGVRELALKLAESGFRTVIWDRPNCGESDISFSGATESRMNADALAGLLRGLDMTPALVIGGSAGARVSLLAAVHHPDVVDRLAILWITGGAVSLALLAYLYCHDNMAVAARDGMEAVANLPGWKEQVERNPKNREILLSQDRDAFVEKMKAWGASLMVTGDEAVPGVPNAQLAQMKAPVMVFRSGKSDVHHPRETSEAVHKAIPGSRLVEPPWGDREWLERTKAAETQGEGLFVRWPLLAPQIIEFANA